MKLQIEIKCDNAIFDEDPFGEIHRLMDGAIGKMVRWCFGSGKLCSGKAKLMDINGNAVGFVKVVDE